MSDIMLQITREWILANQRSVSFYVGGGGGGVKILVFNSGRRGALTENIRIGKIHFPNRACIEVLPVFVCCLHFLQVFTCPYWDSMGSHRWPLVVQSILTDSKNRCQVPNLDMVINGPPVAIDGNENPKNGLCAWKSCFPFFTRYNW